MKVLPVVLWWQNSNTNQTERHIAIFNGVGSFVNKSIIANMKLSIIERPIKK